MLHILDPDYFGLPLVPFLTIRCLSLCGQNNLVVIHETFGDVLIDHQLLSTQMLRMSLENI